MCSPLHIRAPTRPLIFQCVTELFETLVRSVLLSKLFFAKSSGFAFLTDWTKHTRRDSHYLLSPVSSFGNDRAKLMARRRATISLRFLGF
jgi:hypothetical protein